MKSIPTLGPERFAAIKAAVEKRRHERADAARALGNGERCGDEDDDDCPICRGEELSPDFIARIEEAAAGPYIVQTMEEFLAWLDGLEALSPDPD